MIFVTLKDSSLKINSSPFNNCFSYRNALQNGNNALSKIVFKKTRFFLVKKLKIVYISDSMIWFKFRQHVVQMRIK